MFREASGGQWTLHQLRHSALTRLGENAVSAPLLMRNPAIEISAHSRATCAYAPGSKRSPDSSRSTIVRGVVSHRDDRIVPLKRACLQKTPGFRFIATHTPERTPMLCLGLPDPQVFCALTWKGLHPIVQLSKSVFEKGVSLTKKAMKAIESRLHRNPHLPKWDILVYPA
jgi:hypothetical protein